MSINYIKKCFQFLFSATAVFVELIINQLESKLFVKIFLHFKFHSPKI